VQSELRFYFWCLQSVCVFFGFSVGFGVCGYGFSLFFFALFWVSFGMRGGGWRRGRFLGAGSGCFLNWGRFFLSFGWDRDAGVGWLSFFLLCPSPPCRTASVAAPLGLGVLRFLSPFGVVGSPVGGSLFWGPACGSALGGVDGGRLRGVWTANRVDTCFWGFCIRGLFCWVESTCAVFWWFFCCVIFVRLIVLLVLFVFCVCLFLGYLAGVA